MSNILGKKIAASLNLPPKFASKLQWPAQRTPEPGWSIHLLLQIDNEKIRYAARKHFKRILNLFLINSFNV